MVETASPGRLLLMLYDAAIKNLEMAKLALADKNIVASHNALVKAQDIIQELKCSLNMEIELSQTLYGLYEYMYLQLVQANVRKDVEPVLEVQGFLAELRAVWDEAIRKTSVTAAAVARPAEESAPAPVELKSLNIKG